MKNIVDKFEESEIPVIICSKSNGERSIIQKQGQSSTIMGDNLIACNSHLAKSFNILKSPFERDTSGVYYQKILTSVNYDISNNVKDVKTVVGNTDDCGQSIDCFESENNANESQSHMHRSINIHENKFFYDAVNTHSNSDNETNTAKITHENNANATLNVKSCKHTNSCNCNLTPLKLNEALQNISLAYNPITKQLHFSNTHSASSSPTHSDNFELHKNKSLPHLNNYDNNALSHEKRHILDKSSESVISQQGLISLTEHTKHNNAHGYDSHFEHHFISNGYSDGTHSSISEQSDIGESCTFETPLTETSKETEDLCLGSEAAKPAGITGFFSRAVSTIVGNGSVSKGWRLWPGRSAPEQKYSHVVASSTALIQHIRPSTLPAKDSAEESRHRAEYQRILQEARQKEQKYHEDKKTQQMTRAKREEAQANRVKQWQDILPKFEQLQTHQHTRSLWWHGLPPCTRGRVWFLAIGNN